MGNLNGTQFLGNQVKMEGSEYNEWYGYLSDGLFLTQEDVDKSPKLNNSVKVGDIKYKDIIDGYKIGIKFSQMRKIYNSNNLSSREKL